MNKLVIVIIILFVAFDYWYKNTHSFSYKWNKSIERCIDEENLGRKTCTDGQIKKWIDACKLLEPKKTDEQCMNGLDDSLDDSDKESFGDKYGG